MKKTNKCSRTQRDIRGVLGVSILLMTAIMPIYGETAGQPVNLARGKQCKTFSSIEDSALSAVKLTDGQTGAVGWSSKAFSAYADHSLYPEFVVVDLGVSAEIDRVVLHPGGDREDAGKGFPRDFSISVCNEGEPWRELLQKKEYPQPKDGAGQVFSFEEATGRYVKVQATGLREIEGKHSFQLAEFEVFGTPQGNSTLEIKARAAGKAARACRLRCENRDDPVGIDVPAPRLSWWMESTQRGDRQTAYRVLVASSEKGLEKDTGDLWDSGTVESDQSIAVTYAGKTLGSGKPYWWKVQLTDKDGKALPWSKPATFVMGKVGPDAWTGEWIGASKDTNHAAVYLRKEINVEKPVKRAMVYFCGLGFSELYIEGRKVGDYVVGPGFTNYDKRTSYLTFNVTDYFTNKGVWTLAVILADGWYGIWKDPWGHNFQANSYVDKPKLLLELHLEHTDGTVTVVSSDQSWKWSSGEITLSWIAQEDIDLRKANPGWDKAGYDDHAWSEVTRVAAPVGKKNRSNLIGYHAKQTRDPNEEQWGWGKSSLTDGAGSLSANPAMPSELVHQKEPPCRIIEEIKPKKLTHDKTSGTYTYDFGREFTGWVRFDTSGPAGTDIKITAVPSGGSPKRTARFVLAGTGGRERYEPRFWYNSTQRVEIEGLAQPPQLGDITGCAVSSSWQAMGHFRSSDDLVNWLSDASRRTSVNYTTFIPNDASREYKAWMQDPQNMFVANCYMFDSQTLYERWQWDIIDSQRADGNSPNITPGAFFDNYNSPWWGGCVVWLPWHWLQYYGDATLLKDSYPTMKKYVDYLGVVAEKGIKNWETAKFRGAPNKGLQDWGLGDWYAVEEAQRAIINTPAHFLFARIVSETAKMMGNTQDAQHYEEVAKRVADNFNRQLLNRDIGIYGAKRTQGGQVMPLALGVVPEDMRSAVEGNLLEEIVESKNRLTTGFVSTPYLLQVIMDLAPELGWQMTTAQDYPSWYSMTAGSDHDLMMENWRGGMVCMPSLGGNFADWVYQSLGGIRPDPAGPGFKKMIIKPNVVGDLHWVECSYDSVHGRITSNWRKSGDRIVMDLVIPANTTATIYVPARDAASVTESSKPASQTENVTFLRMEKGRAVYEVGSGNYLFSSTNP